MIFFDSKIKRTKIIKLIQLKKMPGRIINKLNYKFDEIDNKLYFLYCMNNCPIKSNTKNGTNGTNGTNRTNRTNGTNGTNGKNGPGEIKAYSGLFLIKNNQANISVEKGYNIPFNKQYPVSSNMIIDLPKIQIMRNGVYKIVVTLTATSNETYMKAAVTINNININDNGLSAFVSTTALNDIRTLVIQGIIKLSANDILAVINSGPTSIIFNQPTNVDEIVGTFTVTNID